MPGCENFSAVSKRTKATIPGLPNEDFKLPSTEEGKFLCQVPIAFEEQQYPARENDYRIFIEGVEVSGYVRGALTWTIESTGGTNTCRFTLNNNHDAFIITPLNVCSNLSLNGWRVDTLNAYSALMHGEPRYDEYAKYLIYKRKFDRVAPGTSKADIDPFTGMWYYPLAPMGLIFNKNDTVRVFRKLSHMDSSGEALKAGIELRNYDLWAPAFAGFIRSASYDDDYINGDRSVVIECYDFRGLMEGMRVRTLGLRLGTPSPGSKSAGADPMNPPEIMLGAAFANAKGSGLLDLFSKIYARYKDACEFKSAAAIRKATDNTALGSINAFAMLQQCVVTTVEKTQPFADRIKKVQAKFDLDNEYLKKLNGEEAVVDLTTSDGWGPGKYKKIGGSAESATATSSQQGASTSPSGNTPAGAAPKTAAPSITAPSLTNAQIGQITSTPEGVYSIPGASAIAPTLNANGDVEKMQALISFFSDPNLVIALYPAPDNAGDKCPSRLTLKDNNDAALQKFSGTCQSCSPDAADKENCKYIDLLRSWACKLNKSIVAYTYSQLTEFAKGYIREKNGMEKNSLNPPVYKDGKGPTSQFETRINSDVVIPALNYAIQKINIQVTATKAELEKDVAVLKKLYNDLLKELETANKAALAAMKTATDADKLKLNEIARAMNEAREKGQQQANAKGIPAGNLAELIVKEPTFERRQAGIFADLIKTVSQGSHPLDGMSYEAAVTWLCCAPTGGPGCRPGRLMSGFSGYRDNNILQNWNKLLLFGIAERPLTYDEVSAIGQASGSDAFDNGKDTFSPYKPFLHFMLPAGGTGARTIVQQDLTSNTGNSTSFQYETRKSLVDRISTLLDYQWFVSPWGDLVFEFPHYNSVPEHWGKQFKGAYILDKEITGITVNEESSDLYSAWVITGMESSKEAQAAVQSQVAQNLFYKVSIIAPILARRIGVRVEHVNLEIPGVGGQIDNKQESGGVEALVQWGLLHIQKQLGLAHRVTIKEFPDRPYLLPNRPLYIVPRQKYCLIKSVTYTMDKPNGDATVSVECGFTRWLYRDGTFRAVAGGINSIVNYSGIFTGSTTVVAREGALYKNKTFGVPAKNSQNPNETAWNCESSLGKQANQAQSFYGADIAEQGDAWMQYPANTSGSGGSSAYIPPSTALGQGKYGTAVARIAPNPANKNVGTTPESVGLRVEDRPGVSKGSIPSYDLTKLFLNPYPYDKPIIVKGGTNSFDLVQSWGFFRIALPQSGWLGYYNMPTRGKLGWHNGFDIFGKIGWDLLAPFDFEDIVTRLWVGPSNNASGNRQLMVPDDDIARKVPVLVKGQVQVLNGKILVYAQAYKVLKDALAVAKNRLGREQVMQTIIGAVGGQAGVALTGFGNLEIPKAAGTALEGKKLRAKINFYHCNDIATDSSGDYYGISVKKASTKTVVAHMGQTGSSTNAPHVHVELSVRVKGGVDAEDAYAEVKKANTEYLTTQLLLKVTGGHPEENKLSDQWKRYFARTYGAKSITTPAEAVEFLIKQNDQNPSNITPLSEKGDSSYGWLAVNPALFFNPWDIVRQVKKELDKLPLKDPQWNTQTFVNSVSAQQSPTCGSIAPKATDTAQRRYGRCMFEAKKLLAANSYATYFAARRKCISQLKDFKKADKTATAADLQRDEAWQRDSSNDGRTK